MTQSQVDQKKTFFHMPQEGNQDTTEVEMNRHAEKEDNASSKRVEMNRHAEKEDNAKHSSKRR